jgi:molybdopterin-containing oxidoreductase family membrane subunit
VSSALVSGLALVIVVVVALSKAGCLKVEADNITKMAKLLGVFTVVDLYLFACDLLTAGYPGAKAADVVTMLSTGSLAPFFWLEVIAGAVTMFVAFVPKARRMPMAVLASVLSIVGILCKRIQLLLGGFQTANIEFADVPSGPQLSDLGASLHAAFPALAYVPSLLEIGVVLGVLSLGVCLVLTGLRLLPLTSKQQ